MAEKFNLKKSFDADYRIGFFERNRTKPTPGTIYTVVRYDWLDAISYATYGYDRTSDIIAANDYLQTRPLLSNPKDPTNIPYPNIGPGDQIYLPPAENVLKEPDTIEARDPEEIAIRINGRIFRGFQANAIKRNFNNIADSFSFTAPLPPVDDSDVRPYLEPFTYLSSQLFIGGELYISGTLEKWSPSATPDKSEIVIEARSLTGVLVDCQSTANSLTHSGTLRQISTPLTTKFGVNIVMPDGEGTKIPKAKRSITDSIFSFIKKLVNDQGFGFTSTVNGDLSFLKADVNSDPVDSFELGTPPLLNVKPGYDGTKRFSSFTGNSQTTGKPSNTATISDPSMTVHRPKIFSVQSTGAGDIETAVKWEMSRSLESAPVSITVAGYRTSKGLLWMENMKIQLYAPQVFIYRVTDYMVRNVSLSKTASGGSVTTMELVLPETYTGEFPKVLPWQR